MYAEIDIGSIKKDELAEITAAWVSELDGKLAGHSIKAADFDTLNGNIKEMETLIADKGSAFYDEFKPRFLFLAPVANINGKEIPVSGTFKDAYDALVGEREKIVEALGLKAGAINTAESAPVVHSGMRRESIDFGVVLAPAAAGGAGAGADDSTASLGATALSATLAGFLAELKAIAVDKGKSLEHKQVLMQGVISEAGEDLSARDFYKLSLAAQADTAINTILQANAEKRAPVILIIQDFLKASKVEPASLRAAPPGETWRPSAAAAHAKGGGVPMGSSSLYAKGSRPFHVAAGKDAPGPVPGKTS